MSNTPPGWYERPDIGVTEWWDGNAWSGHIAPPPPPASQPDVSTIPTQAPASARSRRGRRGLVVAAVLIVLALAGVGAWYFLLRGGLPTDEFAGVSGECVGVDDERDVQRTGWMKPGQADFTFDVSDDGRSLNVTTVDDSENGSPSIEITWDLTEVSDHNVRLKASSDDESPDDLEFTWEVDGDNLIVEWTNRNHDDDGYVFDVDLADAADGEFEVVGRSGGIMRCEFD